MAVTRKVEGWGAINGLRVVSDACERIGSGLIMLAAIGLAVKSDPAEATGWYTLVAVGMVTCYFGGYNKHKLEAILEEEQRRLDDKNRRG